MKTMDTFSDHTGIAEQPWENYESIKQRIHDSTAAALQATEATLGERSLSEAKQLT